MSIVDDLRAMLVAHGIDATQYTDSMLESFIFEAKVLVDAPFVFDTVHEDYNPQFRGDVFMTDNYPVLDDEVLRVTIDDLVVTPEHITHEGIIYLDKTYQGKLKCTYNVGLNGDDIQSYLLPLVVSMIQEKEGLNLSSITEGDVSISYNNSGTGYSSQVSQLVQALKNKYSGRVAFI